MSPATVTLHPCAHFGALVQAVIDRLPHPLSYEIEQNGCRALVRCSSKLAWISARKALRDIRAEVPTFTVRGFATHGRFALAVGVA